jgi:60 kDa SS-A/Ro ribonucleoprotein
MANKTLFASLRDALIPQTDTANSENAPAYALGPKQALAQYAATGCFGRTFYATADEQLTRVLELCMPWMLSSSHEWRSTAGRTLS